MSERTSYLPGTPSWVDIGVPDTAAAASFYGALLGWQWEDGGPEAGGYGMFTLRGLNVAGVGPQQMPDAPPFWMVYVTVEDVDATAEVVTANGGTVVAPTIDVFDAGRMAVFQDPTGVFFSVWEPKEHIGAALVNEPGTFCWNELASPDIAVAREFYSAVFGWGCLEPAGQPAATYTVDGEVVCGSHTAGEGEFPSWSVWFAVDDCDAATAKATELGGSVLMPPNDMSFGRGSVVADPAGGVFGLAGLTTE